MVDKSARSSRAHSVHALLGRASEICNLCVLAAQLYCSIRLRNQRFDR